MASLAEFPWRHMSPQTQQRIGERLRTIVPLLHIRLPYTLGIGACLFLLILWWLTSTSRTPSPPATSGGLELHQLLHALHAALGDPALGQPGPGGSAPFAPKDIEVAVHFVIQPSVPPSGEATYRLVPVDTALQPRPEHVQTLTMRVTPTRSLPHKAGAAAATAPETWTPKEGELLPPARLKKRPKS